MRTLAGRPAALALLGAAVLLAGCEQKKKPGPTGPPTVPVMVAVAAQRSVPLQLTSIGTVEPYSSVSLKAQINGQVTDVHFTEGQDVRLGDLLFTIDSRPYEADLQRAVATLARDEAQWANARAQSARYAELQKQGVVAREQAEAVITNAQALEAAVNADKAAVEMSRVQVQYCKVYAPISGRTGNVGVKMGNLVKANDNPVLVTINQVSPIYVNFTVPEQTLGDVKRFMAGGKLAVTAQAPNQPPVEGVLTFVDNAVDPTTGTIHLKATFENAQRYLWPGQFVTTVLTLTSEANSTVVPMQAVLNGQQGPYVYVLKPDRTAESRTVVVARASGTDAVIRSGIEPGETVVTDGQLRLTPGARVEIKSASAAPPGPPAPPAEGVPARAAKPKRNPAPVGNAAATPRAATRPTRQETGQ